MIGQPPGRLARWLLYALAAFACSATAGTDYTLSVTPAWGGHVKPGVPTEVGVRLLADRGGQARLTLRSSRATVHSDMVFEAGLPVQTQLPVSHESALPVTVELAVERRTVQKEDLSLHMLPADATVVAVVNPAPGVDWRARVMPAGDAIVIHTQARDLPYTEHAYKLLSALFIAESALPEMTDPQRRALAAYTAGCGRLYLSGAKSTEAQTLLGVAGCGARNLVVGSSATESLLPAEAVDPLAASATLDTLLPGAGNTMLRAIVVFLLGYACILLLGARSAKTASALLVLPPAATLLVITAWYLASPRVQVAGLAEMDSGDPSARFAALLQVTGTAPRDIVLGLPVQLGLPAPTEPGRIQRITFDSDARRLDLRLEAMLMSRHTFRFEGIARGSPLAVESTASGVRVTNRGEHNSASAILAWRGQRYTVPGLAAGQEWRQPNESETWGRTAAEQILRQRATDDGSWLLVPHALPALRSLTGATDSAGWLLVRGAADA